MLKYVKLFYISIATLKASSVLVNDKDGKAVALHNMIRSPSGLDHRYTFIKNTSYAHCFRDRGAHAWIYKDPQASQRMVQFSSTLTPIKIKYTSSDTTPPTSRPTQLPSIKPITRSSRNRPPRRPSTDSSSSDDSN